MNDLTTRLVGILDATCASGKVSPAELAQQLDMTLVPGYLDYAEVEPRPAGVAQLLIGLDGVGGSVRFVSALLDPAAVVPLADLETVLRERRPRPTLHPGDPERIGFEHTSSNRARPCTVTVDLLPPEPDTATRFVSGITVVP